MFVAVFFGVGMGGFRGVVRRVGGVALGRNGVVSGHVMLAGFVVSGRLLVVLCSVAGMFGGLTMMGSCFFGHT